MTTESLTSDLRLLASWEKLYVEFVPPIASEKLDERQLHPITMPPDSNTGRCAPCWLGKAEEGFIRYIGWDRRFLEPEFGTPENRLSWHAQEVAEHIGGTILNPREIVKLSDDKDIFQSVVRAARARK